MNYKRIWKLSAEIAIVSQSLKNKVGLHFSRYGFLCYRFRVLKPSGNQIKYLRNPRISANWHLDAVATIALKCRHDSDLSRGLCHGQDSQRKTATHKNFLPLLSSCPLPTHPNNKTVLALKPGVSFLSLYWELSSSQILIYKIKFHSYDGKVKYLGLVRQLGRFCYHASMRKLWEDRRKLQDSICHCL